MYAGFYEFLLPKYSQFKSLRLTSARLIIILLRTGFTYLFIFVIKKCGFMTTREVYHENKTYLVECRGIYDFNWG